MTAMDRNQIMLIALVAIVVLAAAWFFFSPSDIAPTTPPK
jgi:hypothetical protein